MAENEDDPERTSEEQRVIDVVAARKGRTQAEKHAEFHLAQARAKGFIAPKNPKDKTDEK